MHSFSCYALRAFGKAPRLKIFDTIVQIFQIVVSETWVQDTILGLAVITQVAKNNIAGCRIIPVCITRFLG